MRRTICLLSSVAAIFAAVLTLFSVWSYWREIGFSLFGDGAWRGIVFYRGMFYVEYFPGPSFSNRWDAYMQPIDSPGNKYGSPDWSFAGMEAAKNGGWWYLGAHFLYLDAVLLAIAWWGSRKRPEPAMKAFPVETTP